MEQITMETIQISKDLYLKLVNKLCQNLDEEFDRTDGESEEYKAIDLILKQAQKETGITPNY
jgi:hypothetical protein